MGANNPWLAYHVEVNDGKIYMVYKALNWQTKRHECSPVEISRDLAQSLVTQLQEALKWKPEPLLQEFLEPEDE